MSKKKPNKIKIDRRFPIVAIPVVYNKNPEQPSIGLASYNYEVVDPVTGISQAVNVSFDLISRISAANALLLFGFTSPSLREKPGLTWPDKWKYLNANQLKDLEAANLPVLKKTQILTQSIQIETFVRYIYYPNDIQIFFDSWIEVLWQEFVIETELRRYHRQSEKGRQNAILSGQPNAITLQNADTWIPLENCIVRLRSIWERIHKSIVPLYFTGKEAPETTDKVYWKNIDKNAKKLLNASQMPYYDLLTHAILDTFKDPLKDMRDALIHKLSHRPTGLVPASNASTILPNTVNGLYQMVLNERSRCREAILIFVATTRLKTPPNKEISTLVP